MRDLGDASSLDPIPLQLPWLGVECWRGASQVLVVKAFVEAPSC